MLTKKEKLTDNYRLALTLLAEEEGFEPPVPRGTLVFKTSAFDHSAIPPVQRYVSFYFM